MSAEPHTERVVVQITPSPDGEHCGPCHGVRAAGDRAFCAVFADRRGWARELRMGTAGPLRCETCVDGMVEVRAKSNHGRRREKPTRARSQ